jgi:hypothetical protein
VHLAEETSGRGAHWEEREDSRQPILLIHRNGSWNRTA